MKLTGITFDLDLWPTDLNINRGHLLIKNYLPTKFEASGAKRSWVFSCTRWSRLAWLLTLTYSRVAFPPRGKSTLESAFRGKIYSRVNFPGGGGEVYSITGYLPPFKLRWIPFSAFREVENVSADKRSGWPFWFLVWPEKHKFIRGCWYLASCQISLNSVQRFLSTVKHLFFAWPYFRELMTLDLFTRLYFRDYSFLVL